MKKRILSAFFALALAFGANADEVLLYVRTAECVGEIGEAAAIELDRTFYRRLNSELSDLRLFAGNGKPVPYALRVARPATREISYGTLKGKITDFRVDETQNTARLSFSLDDPAEIARLAFPTSVRRFSKRLSLVFYDVDRKVVREMTDLPLYRFDELVGGAHVDFAPVKAQHFTAVITPYAERRVSDVAAETIGPDGKTVKQFVRREAFDPRAVIPYRVRENRVDYGDPVKSIFPLPETGRAEQTGKTVITVDAYRVPCTELEIETSVRRFRRAVEVYAQEENGGFSLIARRVVQPEKTVVPLSGKRFRAYRVEIENGSDEPLENLRLVWRAPKRRIIFVPPAGEGSLTIRYGGAAPKPKYDIESYADDFLHITESFQCGAERALDATLPWWRKGANLKRVMTGTLVAAGVFLLAVIVFFMLRKPDAEEGKGSGNE